MKVMSLLNNIVSALKSEGGIQNGVVGVDIGSSSMKVVELKDKNGVITLGTYGEIQLGPYAGKSIGESVNLEPKQEQEALIDIIRESSINAKSAVLAMPLSASFVTNVSIEADADADLSSMVRVEARKVIPASLSEVTLDWAEVETVSKDQKQSTSNTRHVLIASIQNTALERFNILMKFVGLGKPPTEIECFSTIRGLYNIEEENIAVVDLGAVSSKLYIARKGMLMRMYRIRAGGALATKNISELKKVSFEEAEKLKFAIKKENSDFAEIKRAHDSSYERAFREFNQVIKDYENKTGNNINTIYLTGGAAQFVGMDTYVKSILNREVYLANPFSKVSYPAFMDDNMHEIGPGFAVAVGAALRAFE
jgi:type IV pilus assembly protein PilM